MLKDLLNKAQGNFEIVTEGVWTDSLPENKITLSGSVTLQWMNNPLESPTVEKVSSLQGVYLTDYAEFSDQVKNTNLAIISKNKTYRVIDMNNKYVKSYFKGLLEDKETYYTQEEWNNIFKDCKFWKLGI